MDQAINAWRKQQRAALLERRQTLSPDDRQRAADIVAGKLGAIIAANRITSVGLYWPIKHEINLLPWAHELERQSNLALCLPVVVTPKAPLEYWRWTPETGMKPGFWNIPVPIGRDPITPDLVLAPLVGFDAQRYRLGNGGGYFDRTLSALHPRPIAIGVGYEFAALDTIKPQPHDIPMDAVLTEQRDMLPETWGMLAD